jgi:hypothetical protein
MFLIKRKLTSDDMPVFKSWTLIWNCYGQSNNRHACYHHFIKNTYRVLVLFLRYLSWETKFDTHVS